MNKTLLLLPALGLLAACATPREACINDARQQTRLLSQQIQVARGNIERGYAIATVQEVVIVTNTCHGTTSEGAEFTFPCQEAETVDRQEPVAINVAEERAKLADLERRLATAQRAENAAIQQCIALHPEQ